MIRTPNSFRFNSFVGPNKPNIMDNPFFIKPGLESLSNLDLRIQRANIQRVHSKQNTRKTEVKLENSFHSNRVSTENVLPKHFPESIQRDSMNVKSAYSDHIIKHQHLKQKKNKYPETLNSIEDKRGNLKLIQEKRGKTMAPDSNKAIIKNDSPYLEGPTINKKLWKAGIKLGHYQKNEEKVGIERIKQKSKPVFQAECNYTVNINIEIIIFVSL